jgi:1,4-dihydroxy-2-naphthoate octaprenyltransferase
VTLAVNLVWISVGLGALFVVVKALTLPSPVSKAAVMVLSLLFCVPVAWLNLKMAAQRNWARIGFIGLAIFGAATYLIHPEKVVHLGVFERANFTLQTGLQFISVALLLSRSAYRWFKPPSSPA